MYHELQDEKPPLDINPKDPDNLREVSHPNRTNLALPGISPRPDLS